MSCRFLSDIEYISGDPNRHPVRLLEITFHNGFVCPIYVSPQEAFSLPGKEYALNVWKYEVKENKIWLYGLGSNSVYAVGHAHETIIGWPVTDE